MEDDTSNDTLDYDETKAAIRSLGFIDVVGYDGCNMASLEIMDLWHGHATAITGSQEYVGWDGLEYDVFLKQLKAQPDDDRRPARDQLERVDGHRQDLVSAGRRQPDERPGDRGRPVGGRAHHRAGRQQEGLHAARSVRRGRTAQAPMDKDLYDLAAQVNAKVTDANIRAKGTAVMNAFPSVVLHERHVASTPVRTASRSTARQPRTRRSTSPTTGPSTCRRTPGGTTSWRPSCRDTHCCAKSRWLRRTVRPVADPVELEVERSSSGSAQVRPCFPASVGDDQRPPKPA